VKVQQFPFIRTFSPDLVNYVIYLRIQVQRKILSKLFVAYSDANSCRSWIRSQ